MYNKLPKNTPAILRKHGLKVVEVDGWYGRGRPASTGELDPDGVLCHHTATTKRTSIQNVINLLVRGRSDLPGPLCNFGLGRDGTVYLVAAGRANHAGKAKASGTMGAGDGNKLYWGIEAFNDGVGEPWPAVQYNAYVLLCAVLSVEITKNSEKTVRGHKETSVTGKVDPRFDMAAFRGKVKAKMAQIKAPVKAAAKKAAAPAKKAPAKKAPAKPANKTEDFQVVLVPGNKSYPVATIVADLKQVAKVLGPNGVVFNTERNTQPQRNAVAKGLGKGFWRVHENENTMALGKRWHSVGSRHRLLAPKTPHLAKVSPNRYLNTETVVNDGLAGVKIAMKGSHLTSEANCNHVNVKARAWREKAWAQQIEDIINDVHHDINAGIPVVLAADFNTGVKYSGARLLKRLQKEFGGANVVHAYSSSLDQIYLISTSKVKLSKVGKVTKVNNHSDHDSARVKVRAEVR